MKNALLYFFRVTFCQCIHEMLGFRKHAKWSETTVVSHLFTFNIKHVTLSRFSIFVSSKLIEL